MDAAERYDVLVLGSGTGGKLIAWTMAKQGKRTIVVERKLIGGSCQNIACLPSKNVIHSAKVVSLIGRHQEFGINTGSIAVDMAGVYERKRKMVEELVNIQLDLYRASGAELIMGEGRFIASRTLQVVLRDGGQRTITAERVFVNVGTHATIPDIPGLVEAKPMTHVEALDLQRLPRHLIVVGGGYVGVEFAQAMRRFGSRVTLVARGPQLLAREDADVAQAALQLFRDEGIEVLLSTEVRNVRGVSGERTTVELEDKSGERAVEGTDILVAVGRTPNTWGIGLEKTGVDLMNNGHIRVNERLETTAPNIWAIGECAGSPYFTHVSEDDFNIIHENLNGGNRKTSDRLIPYCIFIDPPLARIGLSESEAQEGGVPYRRAYLPINNAVQRTRTISETRGFLKALIDTESDRILGFTVFGPEAGEMLGAVQVAMMTGQPYKILQRGVFAHPTMNEGFKYMFDGMPEIARNEAYRPDYAHTPAH